jgi:hypothetical protein
MLQVIQGDYGCGTAFQPKATVKEVKPRLRPSRTGCLVPPGLTPSVKPPRCTGGGGGLGGGCKAACNPGGEPSADSTFPGTS